MTRKLDRRNVVTGLERLKKHLQEENADLSPTDDIDRQVIEWNEEQINLIDNTLEHISHSEGALKEILTRIESEKDQKQISHESLLYEIKDECQHVLDRMHYGFVGWGHHFVLKYWLVIEIWKDGRIVPRCASLTEKRADYVADMLLDRYESEEKKNRPKISVEHQRMEHIYGFEMERGRLHMTSDTFSPTKTKVFELESERK